MMVGKRRKNKYFHQEKPAGSMNRRKQDMEQILYSLKELFCTHLGG